MYIFALLLYIILSHIYFYNVYEELRNKYDSKQWVSGIMSDEICGMLFGHSKEKNSTRYDKHKYVDTYIIYG